MTRVTHLPQCMGSGYSKLSDKLRLLMHVLWMCSEPPRLHSVQRLTDQVVSFTSDFGVELGLADVQVPRLKEALAPWVFPARRIEPVAEAEGDLGEEVPTLVGEAKSEYAFKHAIVSGGILHVIHNLSWKMDRCLAGFSQYLDNLKAVVTLLHEKYYREYFIEKCVRGTLFDHPRNGLKRGIPSTTEWRWNSIILVLDVLMPLRTLLCATFSAAKMNRAQDQLPVDAAAEKPVTGLIYTVPWKAHFPPLPSAFGRHIQVGSMLFAFLLNFHLVCRSSSQCWRLPSAFQALPISTRVVESIIC